MLVLMIPARAGAAEVTPEQYDTIVATRIARVLPGVVGILAEAGAEVTLACGKNDVHVVKSNVERETATGFSIHPDGWTVTNGHVVTAVWEGNEKRELVNGWFPFATEGLSCGKPPYCYCFSERVSCRA